ncbi:MAG: macrolide ABC transporter ATP-binding protein [Candidatus Magasanikbacteria bacterium CG_4_10_14_0_8_um_filter_32_14]|uniref:Macrolide ABC transporter ATP-binding protein n=2 Tax=Candidatus Magasanikiibacteriota TaxID=1752731 RepID=A0A2M7RAK3_9BACT|nr:MAG: macrolide ABC transporter ATP-binding protein [Candidatus Magasanikbacteria bacterium CG1_02_32_51]PIY93522.1 MAG: macrolide ABC transporter ATP-binding protein [Candidatus Magasanikbacteria bacterium CG_4_10_14_0_8_um_filter_32_14]
MSKLIEVKDLTKQYENGEVVTKILHGLTFDIEKGEFVSIMGPSGSGKSTLMHILGFLDTLTSGTFLFEGRDVSQLSDDELADMRSNKIGFVFQAFNLLNRSTTLENVMLPLLYTKVSKKERVKRATELLIQVGLGHRLDYSPSKLSGGEKQRVAIARALVNDPEVIFADEPTGNLDSKSGLQVMKILQDLNRDKGHSIILVTHEKYTAEHAERIITLKDGLIESDKPVEKRQIADENGTLIK